MVEGAGHRAPTKPPHGLIVKTIAGSGRVAGWLITVAVFVQFSLVLLRNLFNTTSAWADEFVVFVHAGAIALGIGWALLADRHVRIDVFRGSPAKRSNLVIERAGLALLFCCSLTLIVLSWPFVMSSWSVFEGSRETGGLPGVFLAKSLVILLPVMLGLAAFCLLRNRD